MDSTPLATRLRIPPQTQHAIYRARLIDSLERGLPGYRLALIAAPAGYGKTTMLAQWARATAFTVAWLSLGHEDNDLARFLRGLFGSWEKVQPGIRDSRLGLLLSEVSPDNEAVLPAFLAAANAAPDQLVFVLDDYHLIEDPAIHAALAFLLDNRPPNLRFVLGSRAEPPLPLARYRARNELLEFQSDDLQFSPDEAADFLNGSLGLELSPDEVMALQTRLEGWIAGLQLAALSRQRRLAGTDEMVVSGRHRFIADFLNEDVLASLVEDKRQFLLQTSILDSLCGSLCAAVTGVTDSQTMLETLERENLFLMPLDDSRQWFRYHGLFADFLHEELRRRQPDQLDDLHRRAARWYLAQGLSEPAFHHAFEGGDVELVVQIFDRYTTSKLNGGEVRIIGQWINALPEAWYAAYPVLGIARVGFLIYTGAFEDAFRLLADVEQRLTPAESANQRWQLARVNAVYCLIACTQNDIPRAEVYADQALQELSAEDLSWRPGVYVALGDAYRHNSRWAEARDCYLQALTITAAPQLRFLSVHVFGALADLSLRQGRLRDAADYWNRALLVVDAPDSWGRLALPVAGWVYIRLGELLYEWNDLANARGYLSHGLERAELGGDVRALIAGYLLAGRMSLAEGDEAQAAGYLEQARPLVEESGFPEWESSFERLHLELKLARDRPGAVGKWAGELLRGGTTEGEDAHLNLARVLIVKGDVQELQRANSLLEGVFKVADAEGRKGTMIEALALRALLLWKRGDQAGSLTALEHALRLAEPEGYIHLFADLGRPLIRPLQEARSRAVMPEYVGKLLAALGAAATSRASASAAPLEPLSAREQEILELLAAGLTNQEIADKLVIARETVKKHTGNIFSKLGVSNRTGAAARARELDLLP